MVPTYDETESRRSVSPDVLTLIDEWGPEKIVRVSDPRTGMRGVLVLDNTARLRGRAGTRMSLSMTVHEDARLARAMTWEWAAVDLYHGVATAGILGDPNDANKEAILRALARALVKEVPSDYVFGLDMGLAESDSAISVDEVRDRGAAVGLPRALGGVPYDDVGVTGFRGGRIGRRNRRDSRSGHDRHARRDPGLWCRRPGRRRKVHRARCRRRG